MSEEKVTTQDVSLKEGDVSVELGFNPSSMPWPVVNDLGRVIGAATPSFEGGRLKLHLILDPHNPEAFDFDVEPTRVDVRVDFDVWANEVCSACVHVSSK